MKSLRSCIYTWEWQKLRVGLQFTNMHRTESSYQKLINYVLEKFEEDEEKRARFYRVHNLAAAVKMGFRGLQKTTPDLALRKELNSRITMMDGLLALTPLTDISGDNVTQVKKDQEWGRLWVAANTDWENFHLVQEDLTNRFFQGKGSKGTTLANRIRNRYELYDYIQLMAAVENNWKDHCSKRPKKKAKEAKEAKEEEKQFEGRVEAGRDFYTFFDR